MNSVYFLIPQPDVEQRHLNLSVGPDASAAALPVCIHGGVTCSIVEVTSSNRFHDAFLDYRALSMKETRAILSNPRSQPREAVNITSRVLAIFGL